MSQQEFIQPRHRQESQEATDLPQAQEATQTQDVDALLDDIDSILETNATAFVQGFVQKGGQ